MLQAFSSIKDSERIFYGNTENVYRQFPGWNDRRPGERELKTEAKSSGEESSVQVEALIEHLVERFVKLPRGIPQRPGVPGKFSLPSVPGRIRPRPVGYLLGMSVRSYE